MLSASAIGVLAAAASSLLGGSAVAVTRLAVRSVDPLAVATIRYAIAALCLLPVLFAAGLRPKRGGIEGQWPAALALCLLFFGLFPYLFTTGLKHTTAARGALALATMPMQTLLLAAAFGAERLTAAKLAGVVLALAGLAIALSQSLGAAGSPEAWRGAWRGDLMMAAAGFLGAVFNVGSRFYLVGIPALPLCAAGTLVGSLALSAALAATGAAGGAGPLSAIPPGSWGALVYLGVIGGALTFFLWVFALTRATPTRVAVTVTLNPVSAMTLGALILGEALAPSLILGLAAVVAGIALCNWPGRKQA